MNIYTYKMSDLDQQFILTILMIEMRFRSLKLYITDYSYSYEYQLCFII